MNKIIAFTGSKGSGKSTAKNILQSIYPDAICLSFADPLKELISLLFSLEDECYNPLKKDVILNEWNVTPRQLMQTIGTDLFRDCLTEKLPSINITHSTLWVTLLHKKISKIKNKTIIIDDCRFNDEYNCIKDLKGVVIKIKRRKKGDIDHHKSEIGCNYDFEINNNSTIDILKKNILNII